MGEMEKRERERKCKTDSAVNILCRLCCASLPTLQQLQLQPRQQHQRPQQCDFHETALIDDPAFDGLILLLQSDVFFDSPVAVKANGDLLTGTYGCYGSSGGWTEGAYDFLSKVTGVADSFYIFHKLSLTVPTGKVVNIDGADQMLECAYAEVTGYHRVVLPCTSGARGTQDLRNAENWNVCPSTAGRSRRLVLRCGLGGRSRRRSLSQETTVLFTHSLPQCADVIVTMDTESLDDTGRRNLDVRCPTCIGSNRVLAQIIASLTASLRFGGTLNVDVIEFSRIW